MKFTGRYTNEYGQSRDILECEWCETQVEVPKQSVHIPDYPCPKCDRQGKK